MTIDTRVRFAWGADLSAASGTWTWTDASIYLRGRMQHRFGGADEAGQTQPSAASFRLANEDSRFTPRHPSSPYFPNVRRQTPVEISIDPAGTGSWTAVLQGYVDEFTPVWAPGGTVAEVQVTASGVTRRLGQGTPPLRSAMYRAYVRADPAAYWPLEDGPRSRYGTSPIAGVGPILPQSGTVVAWGGASGPAGSASVARFVLDGLPGTLTGTVPPNTATTEWRIEYSVRCNALGVAAFNTMIAWETPGSVAYWELDASQLVDGGLFIQAISAAGATLGPYFTNLAVDDASWHLFRVDCWQSGGNLNFEIYVDDVLALPTQSLLGGTVTGTPTRVTTNPTMIADESAPEMGHLAVFATRTVTEDTYDAFTGHAGELASARVSRLATEEVIPCSVSASTQTVAMGPQGVSTLLALWRECEAAAAAILYDGFNFGVSFVAGLDLEDQAVALALDTAKAQIKDGFEPTDDDQQVRNQWTVGRPGGSSPVTYTDTEHVALYGGAVWADSLTIGVDSDDALLDQAAMRVGFGTVEEMRVPALTMQLVDHPELWTAWLSMRPGMRLTADNLFTQFPPGLVDMMLRGASQEWESVSWRVDPINTSPYAPWRTALFANDTGDTGEFVGRFEPDWQDMKLASGVTATGTSLSVKFTTSPAATTTADDLPVLIVVDGEVMRVTAVAGTSSPQTFTVTRSINGIAKIHATDAVVYPSQFPVFSI